MGAITNRDIQKLIKDAVQSNFSAAGLESLLLKLRSLMDSGDYRAYAKKIATQRLTAAFKRGLSTSALEKTQPGIEPYTLANMEPKAQDLLQDAIKKNADKIVLSRESAMAATANRFASWYISGDSDVKKPVQAAHILKPLYNTDYENRRLLQDQGHKLTASINNVIATDAGAIAMKWHQNWTAQPRKEHKALNNKIFVIKDENQYVKDGILTHGDNPYLEDLGTMPAEEVNCVCTGSYIYSLTHLWKEYPSAFTAKGREMMQ